MFLTHREPGVPLSLFRSYPLPFPPPFLLYCSLITLPSLLCLSLIYICCSFRVCCSLIISRFSSFSSILFLTLPVLLCLFHWSIFVVISGEAFYLLFPHCSHMFLTRRKPGVPLSFFRPYPLPFSPPFLLYCSLITPFLLCFFHWSISAVISGEAFYLLILGCFPHCSHMFLTRREPGVPLSLFRPYPLSFSPPFLLYCSLITLPFLLCLFHWFIFAVVSGEAFYLLIICCFPHCSHIFLTRREPGVPLSLFRPYSLPFSPPFLLYYSLPFLFFYVFFIDLYLL